VNEEKTDNGIRWIRNRGALESLVSEIAGGRLALDTEADSFHHYHEKTCLIQISTGSGTSLVDPLAEVDLAPLGVILEAPEILKVLHGADYDLRLLRRDHGLGLCPIFDTMIAARLVGETRFGLASLLERHLGVKLDKKFQRADWSRRPLSREMIEYAAADTRYLLELHGILDERLAVLGRTEWAAEEFRRLESVRWSETEKDPDAFRRTKGASRLDRKGLAVVREIWEWRDETARRRDRPPFRVMDDAALVAVAANRPTSPEALARVPGIPRPLREGKGSTEILRRIRQAVERPPESWPTTRARRPRTDDPTIRRRLGELRRRRDAVAAELGLEPSLLAPRTVLESIAGCQLRGEDWRRSEGLRSWQIRLLEPVID
jgi:ribonuclease D